MITRHRSARMIYRFRSPRERSSARGIPPRAVVRAPPCTRETILALTALATGLFLLLMLSTQACASAAALKVEPAFCDLGTFSSTDPLECNITFGKTTVRVLSEDDWRIEVTMPEPVHRLSDGLKLTGLPSEDRLSSIPKDLLEHRPWTAATGPGSPEWQAFEIDWREIGREFQLLLDTRTPPGTYEAVLLVRLTDAAAAPLTDFTRVTVGLHVSRWVNLSQDLTPIEVSVDSDAKGVIQSEPTTILVTGNTAWELRVVQAGEITSEGGEMEIRGAKFTVCVPKDGVQYLELGPEAVAIARGDAPAASSTPTEEIPILLRLESDEPLPAGRYRTTIIFEVSAQEPSP